MNNKTIKLSANILFSLLTVFLLFFAVKNTISRMNTATVKGDVIKIMEISESRLAKSSNKFIVVEYSYGKQNYRNIVKTYQSQWGPVAPITEKDKVNLTISEKYPEQISISGLSSPWETVFGLLFVSSFLILVITSNLSQSEGKIQLLQKDIDDHDQDLPKAA